MSARPISARRASMHIVATMNFYTAREDLSDADIIVTHLGDPDGIKGELISSAEGLEYNGVLRANQLVRYFSS